MKTCRKCGIQKELDCFGIDKRWGIPITICKVCDSLRGCSWARSNPEKSRKRSNYWSANNPEKHRERTREFTKNNPTYLSEWRKSNPELAKAQNKRANNKHLTQITWRLRNRIARSIRRAIQGNKKGRHWETLAGYTLSQLQQHLENQFTDGMFWEIFNEIHIDHKIPLSAFNFTQPEDIDFKRAWALDNLRPMWAKDNLSKGAKLLSPFQPSLQIGG